jgi:type IV pilus assembly protein PilE
MNTRSSSGFTLIELLVVVAIIGILAAVGVVAYSGYIESAKRKSAENIMQQIGLAQTEHYSDYSVYYINAGTCSPDSGSSGDIETNLLGGSDLITKEIGFDMCIETSGSNYLIKAENDSGCILTVDGNQAITRTGC